MRLIKELYVDWDRFTSKDFIEEPGTKIYMSENGNFELSGPVKIVKDGFTTILNLDNAQAYRYKV